jgi:Flp pilus assembly protein TadD
VGALDALYAFWVNPMGMDDLQNGVPLHVVLGLLAGIGVAYLGGRLRRAAAPAAAAIAVCVLLPVALSDLPAKRGASDGADRLLHAILAETPSRGSVLAVSDDLNAGLAMARAIGLRPDVVALPQQHLWDRSLTADVFQRAGAGLPPTREPEIVRALASRGSVLWEDGPDLPPPGLQVAPAAPLPRLVSLANTRSQPPVEMLQAMRAACDGVEQDPMGRRACSLLLSGLGTTLYRVGDAAGARAMLNVAVGLDERNISALTNLGVVLAATGDFASAAAVEERALGWDPSHYTAAINAARYRLAQGELEPAERLFLRASQIRPDSGAALAGRALCALRGGRPAEAETLISEALRRDPQSSEVKVAQQEIQHPRQ